MVSVADYLRLTVLILRSPDLRFRPLVDVPMSPLLSVLILRSPDLRFRHTLDSGRTVRLGVLILRSPDLRFRLSQELATPSPQAS